MNRSRYRKLWISLIAILALIGVPVVGLGGWVLGIQFDGNVHVVEPGHLYRSAQLNGPALDDVVDRYGIRTIINLRGEQPWQPWYKDEMLVSQKRGLVHIDVPMSATQKPDETAMANLISALRESPEEPILVHCESGADRAGLASALYELLDAGRPVAVAAEQLSFRYGHFPWLGSRTVEMDRAFERIAAAVSLNAP